MQASASAQSLSDIDEPELTTQGKRRFIEYRNTAVILMILVASRS
jgi:hypothetical protein